jgi:hypothetical protein
MKKLDDAAWAFMKTIGLSLLTAELQKEFMMPGLPTSPVFWLLLGAIPLLLQIGCSSEEPSIFSRLPDLTLMGLIFLQFLMGVSAKRWLMLFNPVMLGLSFLDHGLHFASDSYLYMILMNMFYAIAIDKNLHGGQCPTSNAPASRGYRCGC